MEDDKQGAIPDAEPEPTLEFAEGYEDYLPAFVKALNERDQIVKTEKQLAYRKATLSETIDALRPLIFKRAWDINTLSLSDAIRFVFNSTQRYLSAIDVRSKLEDLGYDLEERDNALASIHTAIRRMVETSELHPVEREGKKKAFEAGPELKPVSESASPLDHGAVEATLRSLGLDPMPKAEPEPEK